MTDDSKIIEMFFERSEDAILELSEKYGKTCMKIALNILHDHEDAEECVNDAYLRLWNAIPPQKPDLLPYLCKTVRNLAINRYNKNRSESGKGNYDLCIDEMEEYIASPETADRELEESEVASAVDEFLGTLGETNRMLFVRRYWFFDPYEELAECSGLREDAIRKRLSRIKADLRKFLIKKGYII